MAQGPLADLAQVGGAQHPALAPGQGLEQGDAQGGALLGVGAGAQLVQQHQPAPPGLGQDRLQVQDVAGEGGQAADQGLVVADVRVQGGQLRHLGAGPGRDGAAGAGQGGEQADGLEDHGLAAGVGAGDHHPGPLAVQLQGQGHGVVVQGLQVQGGPHRGQQQGVAGVQQVQPVLAQVGQGAVAQGRPAEQGQGLVGVRLEPVPALEIEAPGAQAVQEVPEEGVHRLVVLLVGLHQVVVQLDRLERLQEHGGAAAGAVQHQPRHLRAPLGPHRQALAAVALDDVGVLEGVRDLPEDLLQLGLDRLEAAAPGPVQVGQPGHLHGVQHAVVGEAAGQVVGQGGGVRQDGGGHLQQVDAQLRVRLGRLVRRPGQAGHRAQQGGHRPQAQPQLPPVLRQGPAHGVEDLVQGLVEGHDRQSARVRGPGRGQFQLP